MEAMILLHCQQATVSAVARDLGETDKRLWRVLDHYVTEAHAAKDWYLFNKPSEAGGRARRALARPPASVVR